MQAFVGGQAKTASDAIGAEAYASATSIAFRQSPTLHTAAHEAAHIVQQRAGVQLSGGVGQVGDKYEQHADAVADRVVQGKRATDLLDRFTGQSAPARAEVQCRPGQSGQVQRRPRGKGKPNFNPPSFLNKDGLKLHGQIVGMIKSGNLLGPVLIAATAILAATSSFEDLAASQAGSIAAGGGTPLSTEAEALLSVKGIVNGAIRKRINLRIVFCDDGVDCDPREAGYWRDVKRGFGL